MGLWKHSSLSFLPAFLALMYIVDELFESNIDRHFKIKHTFNQAEEGKKTHTSVINENLKNGKELVGLKNGHLISERNHFSLKCSLHFSFVIPP